MAETTILTFNATNILTVGLMFLLLIAITAVAIKVFSTWQTPAPSA